MSLRALLILMGVVLPLGIAPAAEPKATPYQSPYRVTFTFPVEELIGDITSGPRGDVKQLSIIPFSQWYSSQVKSRYGAWGPPFAHQPPPQGIDTRSSEWKRQRVIAAALRYVGVTYQHHHLPDWDPPTDWPWKEVRAGRNGKGVDCSNFTAFIYNQTMGLKPSGAIGAQAEQLDIPYNNGKSLHAQKIERPATLAEFSKQLKTGDLLFIKGSPSSTKITHVVFWVGPIGQSPDGAPLICDSTGEGRKDCRGQSIPDGVQLRPFSETSWYYKSAAHALRLIP
jgi:hypothetical protein